MIIFLTLLSMGTIMANKPPENKRETATFAGGCFWCMEPPFEKLGTVEVVAGYTGGAGENPTYKDYAQKGHVEAIQITFDPQQISYKQLLDIFWRQIDPTDSNGQFVDRGPQYRTAIFYHDEAQKKAAEASKKEMEQSERFKKPIVTEITKASRFYKAEKYHQNYSKNHSWRYWLYRTGSGIDRFLKKVWIKKNPQSKTAGRYIKPSDEQLRKRLSPLQYQVTQNRAIEKPFANKYWDNKRPGIYVDIVSGEPLFSSLDKFKSGTGWPSFTKPLAPENIVLKEKSGWFSTDVEVRSKHADSHLGDLFNDGPIGKRYCINSAALLFIPVKELEGKGYGKYKKLFK